MLHRWDGHRFHCNLPEAEFYSYRETGNAGDLLKALDRKYPNVYDRYEVLLWFRLRHDTSPWVIPPSEKPRILFIAAHEEGELPAEVVQSAALIFKQYLDPAAAARHRHLFTIPVGPSTAFEPATPVPFKEREYNAFFAGNLHVGRRKLYGELSGVRWLPFPLLHRLRSLLGADFSGIAPRSTVSFGSGFHKGFSPQDYAARLTHSKVLLCPYGLTVPESMRHFEGAASGCVIVSDAMPDTWYYREAPFVIVPEWKGLKGTLQDMLADQATLQQRHEETAAWWRDVVSVPAVLRYVTRVIAEAS